MQNPESQFCVPKDFLTTQFTICFDKDSYRALQKIQRKSQLQNKKLIKTLFIINWNALDAFYGLFLVLTKCFTLGVNRTIHWNDHWAFFAETSISNTLSTVKLIRNFPIRPERKIILRQKMFGPYFSSLSCVLVSIGVPLCYRVTLQGIGNLRKVTIYVFRHVPV